MYSIEYNHFWRNFKIIFLEKWLLYLARGFWKSGCCTWGFGKVVVVLVVLWVVVSLSSDPVARGPADDDAAAATAVARQQGPRRRSTRRRGFRSHAWDDHVHEQKQQLSVTTPFNAHAEQAACSPGGASTWPGSRRSSSSGGGDGRSAG
eukprot:SAG31_NODE_59_length_29571_cov_20.443506_15_plen_149_part_00